MPDERQGVAAMRDTADAFTARLMPILVEMQERGLNLNAMAAELRSRGIPAPRAGGWTPTAVRQVLQRIVIA